MPSPAPHGGSLVDRIAPPARAEELRSRPLPVVQLNARGLADFECIATGAYSPLEGFMNEQDYSSVVEDLRLASGTVWSLPVTLAVDSDVARDADAAGAVSLADERGEVLGVLELDGVFTTDRQKEAAAVFGTTDPAHPGVKALLVSPPATVGGRITAFQLPRHPRFAEHRLTPAQTRAAFAERGWDTIAGFQTRNPVHRAHEYLQKVALEQVDGLLLHPLAGETKDDDVPVDVRMRCYEILLKDYYPADRILLSVYPAAMRYAGPREAVVHAISRKNYGCSHFIVGRDHAGVGSYYGTFDAQRIFDQFTAEEIGIELLRFEHAFFCRRCDAMATTRTCPHPPSDHVTLSGSAVREMLTEGTLPPPEFSRPEVAQVLIDGYRSSDEEEKSA